MGSDLTTEQTPRRRRLPSSWFFAGVALVVVLAMLSAINILRPRDDASPARVGDVFAPGSIAVSPLPHTGTVLLPWVRLKVAAGEPQDALPDTGGGPANVSAPEGGTFVRVDVELAGDDSEIASISTGSSPRATATATVTLRADGRDYPLTGAGGFDVDRGGFTDQAPRRRTDTGTRYVAVDGTPRDVEVRITVDDETQVVDAADGSVARGRAAALDDAPDPDEEMDRSPRRCGPARRLDSSPLRLYPPPGCRVQALRTSYVDGLGWATSGHEFLVVFTGLPAADEAFSGPEDDSTYWRTEVRTRVRAAGEDPLAGPEIPIPTWPMIWPTGADQVRQTIVEVPQGTAPDDLSIELLVSATTGDDFQPQRQRVRVRWTVDGKDLA